MTHLINKLKAYPHIVTKLTLWWGTKECRDYLVGLTTSDRIGRKGFPFETALVIQELIELHDKEYPKHTPSQTIWDDYI